MMPQTAPAQHHADGVAASIGEEANFTFLAATSPDCTLKLRLVPDENTQEYGLLLRAENLHGAANVAV